MTAMLEVLGEHLPAVERDLIVAGFHLYDVGTPKLSWAELESFIFAAPPGTATHTSRTGGWDRDAQLLAASRMAQQYGKPPPGGMRQPGGHQQAGQGEPALRNMRGQRIHQPPQHDPNKQTKNLLAGATAVPLNEFRDRQEKVHARWREERRKKREQDEAEGRK